MNTKHFLKSLMRGTMSKDNIRKAITGNDGKVLTTLIMLDSQGKNCNQYFLDGEPITEQECHRIMDDRIKRFGIGNVPNVEFKFPEQCKED